MNDDWPFSDPPNLATFTVRQIIEDGHPVLRVVHDAEDGLWQFLEWDAPRMEDALLVCLKYVVNTDPSLRELADLPRGWRASRRSQAEPWQREPSELNGD